MIEINYYFIILSHLWLDDFYASRFSGFYFLFSSFLFIHLLIYYDSNNNWHASKESKSSIFLVWKDRSEVEICRKLSARYKENILPQSSV